MGLAPDHIIRRLRPLLAGGRWLIPAGSALLALLVAIAGDGGRLLWRYERSLVEQGEWWRLVSGHFTHLGWPHLAMNVLALAGTWALVGNNLRVPEWLLLFVIVIAGIDAGFWWLDPQLVWYVGLSGVLHGLLLAGLGAGWRSRPLEALVLGTLLIGKLVYEQWHGALPGSAATAGGDVVVNAHLYGALAGLLGLALLRVRVSTGRPI